MTEPGRLTVALAVAGAICAQILFTPFPAAAQVTAKQVSAAIAAEFGVKVLKIRKSRLDGVAIYLVTVMNAGGNFNEALRVTTLAVDAGTGKRVSDFRHRPSGRRDNQAPSNDPNRQSAASFRQGFIWR